MTEPSLITYPARPVNGGRLENAPPKVGPWICQPKIKDWRAIVHTPTKRIWNRHGKPMSIEKDLDIALSILSGCPFEWLDVGVLERQNQLLRGTIIVFDWIPTPNDILAGPHGFLYQGRRDALFNQLEEMTLATNMLATRRSIPKVLLVQDFTSTPPIEIYERLQQENRKLGGNSMDATDMKNFYEGIVCKRTDKPYPVQLLSPNKETPWMIKHRFDQ